MDRSRWLVIYMLSNLIISKRNFQTMNLYFVAPVLGSGRENSGSGDDRCSQINSYQTIQFNEFYQALCTLIF